MLSSKRFALSVTVVLLMLLSACEERKQPPPVSRAPAASYTLPSEFFIQAKAKRQNDGGVVIEGDTNLPDGLKMWVHILRGKRVAAEDGNVIISAKHFRTSGLSDGIVGPTKTFPPGKYRVEFISIFNGAWQTPEMLNLIGEGGKKLSTSIFSLSDPDVVDSDKELAYTLNITFPPVSEETRAINLVKSAVITVPEKGRSADNVGKVVEYFMKLPGLRPAQGWSAMRVQGDEYTVTFDYINGDAGDAKGVWTANLKTGKVRYVNKYGKIFSWTPDY